MNKFQQDFIIKESTSDKISHHGYHRFYPWFLTHLRGQKVNFLEIGTSSNAVAMGEAYVSLADDAISAYWNPAGLANVKGFEFGLSSQEWVVGINHANFAAAVNMGKYGTISTWYTDFDYGSIEVTNVGDQDGTGEYYNANEVDYRISSVDVTGSFTALVASSNNRAKPTTERTLSSTMSIPNSSKESFKSHILIGTRAC